MFDEPHLKLRIQTLEASNKRLRKHLKQAKNISSFPSSGKLTNCLSEDIITSCKSIKTIKSIEESSMSVNTMLNKGMEYIIERYESDIKKIIGYIDGRFKIDSVFPFSSDSPELLQGLLNRVYKLKIQSKGSVSTNKSPTKSSDLNKLIKEYNQVVIDNQSKCRLILHMSETIQRLYYQQQVSKAHNIINKTLADTFADSIYNEFSLKPINKLRAAVTAVRFSYRLTKTQKQIKNSVELANIKLIQSPILYSKLYKSYCYGFQYSQNESTIKKYITKDPEKGIMKLLNHSVFFDRFMKRNIQLKMTDKEIKRKQQIQNISVDNRSINANNEEIIKLQQQMLSTLKHYQQQRTQNSFKLQEYKQKVKNLNQKVTTLQSKFKKLIKSQ